MFHAPASSWSSGFRQPTHGHVPPAAWLQPPHAPGPVPHRAPAYVVRPPPHRTSTPPAALYVVLSFALMLLLAALTSVVGSLVTLALFDEAPVDGETTEVASPAASLTTR